MEDGDADGDWAGPFIRLKINSTSKHCRCCSRSSAVVVVIILGIVIINNCKQHSPVSGNIINCCLATVAGCDCDSDWEWDWDFALVLDWDLDLDSVSCSFSGFWLFAGSSNTLPPARLSFLFGSVCRRGSCFTHFLDGYYGLGFNPNPWRPHCSGKREFLSML